MGAAFVVEVACLDGEPQAAVLAVDADDLRFHLVADVELAAGVRDAVHGNLRHLENAAHVLGEFHLGLALIHVGDNALDDAVALVNGDVVGEGVLVELLDAKRDALALGVDGKNDSISSPLLCRRMTTSPGSFQEMSER